MSLILREITTHTIKADKNVKITPIFKQKVDPPPKVLNIVSNPGSLAIRQGQSGTSTIILNRIGFSGEVNLFASSPVPVGLDYSLAENTTTADAVLVRINVGSNVPVGTYRITVNGTTTQGTSPAQALIDLQVLLAEVVTPTPTPSPSRPVITPTPSPSRPAVTPTPSPSQVVSQQQDIQFIPPLNSLVFPYTQRSSTYPAAVTVRAENPSTSNSYTVQFGVDTRFFTISPNLLNIPPRGNATFTISPVREILNTLAVGNLDIELTVDVNVV
jgi:hypothetical protein